MSYRGEWVQKISSSCITLRSQLLFKPPQVRLSFPSDEKIDMIAEKYKFWPKFPTSKTPYSRICHSLRVLISKGVCASTYGIRIY